jgi:CheY-like chemotaxis protein
MSAKAAPNQPAIRILVAEDDPNDVLLLKRAFAKAQVPAALFFVSNGQEAISYLEGQAPFDDRAVYPLPNLLLLDLNMPGLGGLEVLQWLAAQHALAGLRIAVISSCLAPEACRQAVKLGAHCCVTKPLDPLQLLPVFRELQGPPGSPPG